MHSTPRMNKLKWLVFLPFLLLLTIQTKAASHPKQQETNETINKLYHSLNQLPKSNMALRLDIISAQFVDKVYILGALGEGSNARFDQKPRYRTDAFDCDTYVTTVLALALADNVEGFKQCMSKVRYKDGEVKFITRNHFMSLDWNPNNQRQGFIKDITESIKNKNNQSVAKIASALIDKPSWYQHFTRKNIRLNRPNEQEEESLAELKEGSKLQGTPKIPIFLYKLFDAQGKPTNICLINS